MYSAAKLAIGRFISSLLSLHFSFRVCVTSRFSMYVWNLIYESYKSELRIKFDTPPKGGCQTLNFDTPLKGGCRSLAGGQSTPGGGV